MNKISLLLFVAVVSVSLSGCHMQVQGPPWSDFQVKQMEQENIQCIPLLRITRNDNE